MQRGLATGRALPREQTDTFVEDQIPKHINVDILNFIVGIDI